MITPDDVDDRKPLEYKTFVEFIMGDLYVTRNTSAGIFLRDCSWTAYNL